MKQVLAMMIVFLGAFHAQALTILPAHLSVHEVHTGLRPTGEGGYRGPISVIRSQGGIELLVDHNACTVDGLCTMMAPLSFDASLILVDQNATYEQFVIYVTNPQPNVVAKQYTLTVFLNSSQAILEEGEKVYEATNYVWVLKHDGSIACGYDGVEPYEMSQELTAAGIEFRKLNKATTGAIVPAVCGIPTTKMNAYLIPQGSLLDASQLGYTHMDAYPYAGFLSQF